MNPAWAIAAILIGTVLGGAAWSQWRLRRRRRKAGPGAVPLSVRLRRQPMPAEPPGAPLSDAEMHAWVTAMRSLAAETNPEVAANERLLEDHLRSGCCEQHRAAGKDHAREPGSKDQAEGEEAP